MKKQTFLGFDITPRRVLWQEVWRLSREVRQMRVDKHRCTRQMWNGLQDIVSAIAEEQSESRHSKQTAASLTESLRKAEAERVEALKKCASLEDRLARYERPKDSKGRFCKKTPQPVAPVFAPRTVGLCGLDWMAEPLTGYGGTEIDGRTYYTQDEALEAARRIGNGWRLPTKKEFCALAAEGSTWVDKGPNGLPGRWFGGNHDTDHEGSLFFEASGYRTSTSGGLNVVGSYGYAWSSSPSSASSVYGSNLYFDSSDVIPEYYCHRSYGFPVRLVREAQ